MRYAARTDANHAEIVRALRAVGATVADLASVGGGVPDLLVGYQGVTVLIEVKDGTRPPSARKLRASQDHWHTQWRGGPCVTAQSVDDALRAIGVDRRG